MWNIVKCGYDIEDETANFGTRAVAVGSNGLFEVNTLATIEADQDILESKPNIQSCLHQKLGLIVAIDSSFLVFYKDCSQIKLNIRFQSNVDCFLVSNCGNFIFIGLNDGIFQCLFVQTGEAIFTSEISESAKDSRRKFVSISDYSTDCEGNILIFLSSGAVFRLSKFQFPTFPVNESQCNGTIPNNSNVSSMFDLKNESTNTSHIYSSQQPTLNGMTEIFSEAELSKFVHVPFELFSCSHTSLKDGTLSVCCGKNDFSLLPPQIDEITPVALNLESTMKKMVLIKERFILGLTVTNVLVVICPFTLQLINAWEGKKIQDFIVLKENDCDILAFVDEEPSSLLLLRITGFQIKLSIQTEGATFLIDNVESADDFLFLEMAKEENIIFIKMIVESMPEFRLERLLKKCRFEQAEKFALTFNLPMEVVYKAEAQVLLHQLQPWTESETSIEENFTEALRLLTSIKDIEFVSDFIFKAVVEKSELFHHLLYYGKKRLQDYLAVEGDHPKAHELLSKMVAHSIRFDSFLLLDSENQDIEDWLEFSKIDPLEKCISFVEHGELEKSSIIWSRHLNEISKKISDLDVRKLFYHIPSSLFIGDIFTWLQEIVPYLLEKFPNILEEFVSWCVSKIWELERRKPMEWPVIGVQLSEQLLDLICKPKNLLDSEMKTYLWHFNSNSYPVKELIKVIKVLRQLTDLQQNYLICISYSDFMRESAEEVVFILLKQVSIDKCSSLINVFLDKYFLEFGLSPDVTIAHFVILDIERSLQWWKCENIMIETKIIKLIECIISIENKVECIVCLLKNATIPWSPIVSQLADRSMNLSERSAKLIKECYEIVPIKQVLKKYAVHGILTTKSEITKCVQFIFKEGLDSRLEDCLQLVKGQKDRKLTLFPYFIYVDELIMSNQHEELHNFLTTNCPDSDVAAECCVFIVEQFSVSQNENYFSVIDAVLKIMQTQKEKYSNNFQNFFNHCIELALVFKNVVVLKRDYGIVASQSTLVGVKSRKTILRDYFPKILEAISDLDENEVSTTFEKEALKMKNLIDLPFEEIILEFADCAVSQENFNLAITITSLITNSRSTLSCGASSPAISLSSKLIDCHGNIPFSSFSSSLPVIKSLSALGFIGCQPFALNHALDVHNKSTLLNEFCCVAPSGSMGSVLCPLYLDPVSSITSAPFATNFILNLFAYCHTLQDYQPVHGLSQDSGEKESTSVKDEVIPTCIKSFKGTVMRLFEEQQDLKCLRMVCSLLWQCYSTLLSASTENELLKNSSILHSCISALLKKVLGAKHLDFQLALSLLHYFSSSVALKWLFDFMKNCGHDCHRLGNASHLGLEYCKQHALVVQQKQFHKIYLQCMWSKRLLQFNLSQRDSLKQTEKEQKQLLLKMMTLPNMTVSILLEYCADFKFDSQEYLLVYLKHLLCNWEPQYEVEIDLVGKKKLIMKSSAEELFRHCSEVAILLDDSQEYRTLLGSTVWNTVNYYFYEVYQVTVDLLQLKNYDNDALRKFKLIIFFLMSYQRLSEPSEYEKDFWFMQFPNSQKVHPISAFRLPVSLLASKWFKTASETWKIVKPELNIETYKQWFDVLNLLGLDKNALCTLAINKMVIENINENKNEWCVHVRYAQLLNDIRECVEHITDLEMASASLYYVVNQLPAGADQLAAIELCLLQARHWYEIDSSLKVKNRLDKVEKKYLSITTTHVLHVNNLVKPDYLNLVLEPVELIKELYHDCSIIERTHLCASNDIDVNSAAKAIAKLHSVNLTTIRLQLLDLWLQPVDVLANDSHDDSFSLKFSENTVSSCTDENFIRACYILENDLETSVRYLVGLIYATDIDNIKPVSVQLRALKCLCAITPSAEYLEEITARDLPSIHCHLQCLMYLHELEKLGLVYSIEGFKLCNKSELIECLLNQRSRHSIKIAMKMSQDFDINNCGTWKDIVSSMVKFSMIDELKVLLPSLNGLFELVNLPEIKDAWNVLLLKLLEQMEPNDFSGLKEFKILLNSCPEFSAIDMQSIRDHCQRIDAMHVLSSVESLAF